MAIYAPFHFGDKFFIQCSDKFTNGGELLLAQVEYNTVCLVDANIGNRITNPRKVEDSTSITREEFEWMLGEYCRMDELRRVEDGRKKFKTHINRIIEV